MSSLFYFFPDPFVRECDEAWCRSGFQKLRNYYHNLWWPGFPPLICPNIVLPRKQQPSGAIQWWGVVGRIYTMYVIHPAHLHVNNKLPSVHEIYSVYHIELCIWKRVLVPSTATASSSIDTLFFVAICRNIFKNSRFPTGTKIVGYARSALTVDNLKEKCKPYLKVV